MSDKLKELLSHCAAGCYININAHKDIYQTTADALADIEKEQDIKLPPEDKQKMIETDTIIEIIYYPRTPIVRHQVLHWDIDQALDEAIAMLD